MMVTELEKRIEEEKKRKKEKVVKNINFCSSLTSEEIMKKFKPVTYGQDWYNRNCIGLNTLPAKAVNGHNGGTPFYTADKKIMRSGATTWSELKIRWENHNLNLESIFKINILFLKFYV